jgi:hypothetical protein
MELNPEQNQDVARLERVEGRLSLLEEHVAGLRDEVRTRQLIVVDDDDHPRIVGEVFGDVAELRLELPGTPEEPGPELLLFAIGHMRPGPDDLGPAIGLQLRAGDGALFELDAWPDGSGAWRPHLHSGGG